MSIITTNTRRPGETPAQDAARTDPRGVSAARPAKLAFLTQPAPGVYHLNLRVEGEDFYRIEISKAQLANIVVDGAGMALRSIRLGPESLVTSGPYVEPA
jgi:hypothetical protein